MDRDRIELDPLIPPAGVVVDYQTGSIMRRPDDDADGDDAVADGAQHPPPIAAVASRGPSRQLFYRDRISHNGNGNGNGGSSASLEPRGEYAAPPPTQQSHPTPPPLLRTRDLLNGGGGCGASSSSSSSSDSSCDPQHGPLGSDQQPRGGGGHLGGLPPPKQLHEDYSHRLHRNQLAQGHQNFVVGGAHGRYRDYGGTLVEVPEEVYAVRQAALTVLDPITYCWVSLLLRRFCFFVRNYVSYYRPPLSPPPSSIDLM
jgi:hypothetical protein